MKRLQIFLFLYSFCPFKFSGCFSSCRNDGIKIVYHKSGACARTRTWGVYRYGSQLYRLLLSPLRHTRTSWRRARYRNLMPSLTFHGFQVRLANPSRYSPNLAAVGRVQLPSPFQDRPVSIGVSFGTCSRQPYTGGKQDNRKPLLAEPIRFQRMPIT